MHQRAKLGCFAGVWRFTGFHPFDLNMLINIPVAQFSSSTGGVALRWCNFMTEMNEQCTCTSFVR